MDLRVPETWDEYLKQVEFFTKDGNGQVDFYGVVNQGLRPDPIAMEWSNYLFANGGEYYDDTGSRRSTRRGGRRRSRQYATNINEYGPLGAASFCFDEAFNVMAQGKAYSYITYNFFRAAFDDPEQSAVVGKVEIAAGAERRPERRLGLGDSELEPRTPMPPGPSSSGSSARRSPRSARCSAARRPATDVFDDPELAEKYPYYPALSNAARHAHNFPVFTYTPQFVEVLGRELSLAVTGEKSSEEALADGQRGVRGAAREGRQALSPLRASGTG